MRTFEQFLKDMGENGLRTSLGIYPPAYGVAQYPPLYFTPISASAPFSLEKIHKYDVGKVKSKKKKHKKKGDK